MKYTHLILISLCIVSISLIPAFASHENFKPKSFKTITVTESGRSKPFETYANFYLLRLSGRTSYKSLNASTWLTKAIFKPDSVVNDKVFLINNPEIAEALGIKPDHKRRYSFADIEKGGKKLEEYAEIILQKEDQEKTDFDKEMLRVFINFQSLIQVFDSFSLFAAHPDFDINEPETRNLLKIDNQKNSIFDILQSSNKLHEAMAEIERLPANYNFNKYQEEVLRLSISLYTWVEGHKDFEQVFYKKEKFLIIPAINEKNFTWISPWDLFNSLETLDKEELFILNKIYKAYHDENQAEFNKQVGIYSTLVKNRLTKFKQKTPKTSIELLYNRLKPFGYAKLLYGLSLLICFFALIKPNPTLSKINLPLIITAASFHAYGLISRILILERAPVSNLYETFIFVSLICVILGLILHFNFRDSSISPGLLLTSVSGFLLLLISSKFASEGDTMQVLIAVLNSNFWLSTHVICITIGYAGTFAAGIIGHIYLIQKLQANKEETDLKKLSYLIYGVLGFGICFSFLGTMLGGIWADQSWGRFWGWDPKENGALLIVLWTAVLFHARMSGIIKQDGLAIGSIIGSMVVMISWFGINLLGVGLHSYGFTSGIAIYLFGYMAFEIIFILTFVILNKLKHRHAN